MTDKETNDRCQDIMTLWEARHTEHVAGRCSRLVLS